MRFSVFPDELGRIAAHRARGKVEQSLYLLAPMLSIGLQLPLRQALQEATAGFLPLSRQGIEPSKQIIGD
jgi:hypothetical protein